jgi:hypothetical protein
VRRKIEPSGDVADNASPALASIRDRLRKQKSKLRSTLESFLRERDTSKYLQEQVVTDRNGRYVLMVRAEHRGSIPGIVHGASASGQSLFLEPLGTVEINNDIVELEDEEAGRSARILLELTDAFRRRPDDLERTFAMATELDTIQARARFSQTTGGVEPMIAPDGAFELRAARHPLLTSKAVPVDVLMTPPDARADHRGAEHRRQDRGAQDGGPLCRDGAGGAAPPRRQGHEAAGLQEHLRRHRRRAVDLGEPEHVLGAHHQRGVDGPQPGAAGAGAARRGGRGHGPG